MLFSFKYYILCCQAFQLSWANKDSIQNNLESEWDVIIRDDSLKLQRNNENIVKPNKFSFLKHRLISCFSHFLQIAKTIRK